MNGNKYLYCKLSDKIINIIKDNPHTGEYFCNYNNTFIVDKGNHNRELKNAKGIVKLSDVKELFEGENIYSKFTTFGNYYAKTYTRTINDDFPQIKYEDLAHKLNTVIHWGQRKLLIGEIEFLTKYSKKDDIIIYVGAAPGYHIIILNKLFPDLYYVLIDPRSFFSGLNKMNNVRILNVYLDEKISKDIKKQFSDKRILLISDIRREHPTLKDIEEDMLLQKHFYKILKPDYSMFKFKLPYDPGITTYMKGKIYLQSWAPIGSTETRLIVGKDAEEIEYDNHKYEENLSYFNRIMRCQYYKHNYKVPNMDHCYDCSTEFYILEEYYDKYGDKYLKSNKNNKKNFVENLSKYITKKLSQFTKNHFILNYKIIQ